MSLVDIIIPTYNNPSYLNQCVQSLMGLMYVDMARVIIVNNGEKDSVKLEGPYVDVIYADGNKGWEGGLKIGLEHSKADFVCFMNDDVYFPTSSGVWLQRMLQHFMDPKVGAVGPSCNNIRGAQNIWSQTQLSTFKATYLIGLCFLMRREALEKAGGVDDTLPGGDDIDLSIRLRKCGYDLIIDRNIFVYHHLSTTGKRVRKDWDSLQHQEAYNRALWEKHGLKELLYTYNSQVIDRSPWEKVNGDPEGDTCKKYVVGEKVYELGIGDKRTCCDSIGVDIIPKGEKIDGLFNRFSEADVVANVFEDLPFRDADTIMGRHILEHTHDPLGAILTWKKSLKPHGGRLIVAVPDETKGSTIPLNPQHKSAFTPDSLNRLMQAAGMKLVLTEPSGNPISFVGVYERNGD